MCWGLLEEGPEQGGNGGKVQDSGRVREYCVRVQRLRDLSLGSGLDPGTPEQISVQSSLPSSAPLGAASAEPSTKPWYTRFSIVTSEDMVGGSRLATKWN